MTPRVVRMIQFFAEGTPAPAVRKNRSDRWRKRPSVMREYAWREAVTLAARQRKSDFAALQYPVRIELCFALENPAANMDSDNLYKPIPDALVYADLIQGDSLKWVRGHSVYAIQAVNGTGCLITITTTGAAGEV